MPFFPRSPGKSHWLYRLLHKRSAFQILFIDNICTDRCLPPLSCPKSQASVKGIHVNTSCIYKPFCYLSEKMILSKGIFSVLDCYLPLFELPPTSQMFFSGKLIKNQGLHHMLAACFKLCISIGLSGEKFSWLHHQMYT